MPQSEREMAGRALEEDDRFSPPQRVNGRYVSEDDEDDEAPFTDVRDKGRYTHEGRRGTVPVKGRAKGRDKSEDEEVRHPRYVKEKRRDTSESESEGEEERHLSHVRKKRRDSSEDEAARGPPEVRAKRRYSSEDEEERQPPQTKEKRRFSPDDEGERRPPDSAEKRVGLSKDGERNVRVLEESADQEMYDPLEVCMINCGLLSFVKYYLVAFF